MSAGVHRLVRSALATGLVVVPFSLGSLIRHDQQQVVGQDGPDGAGSRLHHGRRPLTLAALVVRFTAPFPSNWDLVGPLLLAGLGSGMVVAPNQAFVLERVPETEAGTAGAILGTAQRVGSAIGIAVIGSVLFANLHVQPGPNAEAVAFSHSSQLALLANVASVVVALLLVVALPRQIPSRR
jgi:MFS family permease